MIAVWQYYLTSNAQKKDLSIIQVQRAIDLSQFYKDNVLKYIPAINYVYKQSGLLNLVEKVKPEQMIVFDECELNSLFTKADIKELKKIQESDEFFRSVLEANDIYGLQLHFKMSKVKDEDGTITTVDKSSIIIAFMANLVTETLNNLEFFALHFKHNTADESVIYQSLHQTFIEFVSISYIYIANGNKCNSSDKLYTNVIWLYNIWIKKNNKQNKIRSITDKAVQSDGTIIE